MPSFLTCVCITKKECWFSLQRCTISLCFLSCFCLHVQHRSCYPNCFVIQLYLLFLEFHSGEYEGIICLGWKMSHFKFILRLTRVEVSVDFCTFFLKNSLRKIIWLGVLLTWGKLYFFYTREETVTWVLLKCPYIRVRSEERVSWLKWV